MKKALSEETQTLLAVVRWSQKISPWRRPLPGGAGRSKFNQLEKVYLYLQTKFGEDRCTQFRVIMVTVPPTHPQTGPITIHCAAASAQCNMSPRQFTLHTLLSLSHTHSYAQLRSDG